MVYKMYIRDTCVLQNSTAFYIVVGKGSSFIHLIFSANFYIQVYIQSNFEKRQRPVYECFGGILKRRVTCQRELERNISRRN